MARPTGKQDEQREDGDEAPPPGQEGPPPFWEWVVAAVGLLLVAACLGYLTLQALAGPRSPPDPVARVLEVRQQGGRYLVRVRVHNRGQSTAEGLKLVGELRQGTQVLESSETAFEFLPGESSREGGLFFARDPRLLQLELRPESYQSP